MPCLVCLKKISTAKFNEKGALVDAGVDLNAGGFAEWILDLIILTGGCQLLASFWIGLWVIWLSVSFHFHLFFDWIFVRPVLIAVSLFLHGQGPAYAFYVFWVNVAYPWICAPAPEEEAPERNEKKERKQMRKQQRVVRG